MDEAPENTSEAEPERSLSSRWWLGVELGEETPVCATSRSLFIEKLPTSDILWTPTREDNDDRTKNGNGRPIYKPMQKVGRKRKGV